MQFSRFKAGTLSSSLAELDKIAEFSSSSSLLFMAFIFSPRTNHQFESLIFPRPTLGFLNYHFSIVNFEFSFPFIIHH
jgi:hypothetical protein